MQLQESQAKNWPPQTSGSPNAPPANLAFAHRSAQLDQPSKLDIQRLLPCRYKVRHATPFQICLICKQGGSVGIKWGRFGADVTLPSVRFQLARL